MSSRVPFRFFAIRRFATSTRAIQNVTVIGGGLMGSGIASVCANAGKKVTLVDVSDASLAESRKKCIDAISFMSKSATAKPKFEGDFTRQDRETKKAMENITFATDRLAAVQKADLVVEAIPERMPLKKELWTALDPVAPVEAIFCSNTSSLPIEEMAAVTKRPSKFAGLHFFSPVHRMNLVEIVSLGSTDPGVSASLKKFCQDIGKSPVMCKDTPGFIVNRLLVPYIMEAIRLVERGDATVEDVDTAMKLGAGYPMGPFTLADMVGNDVVKFIVEGWHQKFPEEPLFFPSKMLDKMIADNKLGQKTGEGFYKYKK